MGEKRNPPDADTSLFMASRAQEPRGDHDDRPEFIRQDPFVAWGNGEQIRNWTYVGDIVSGTIRAAEVIEDGTAINLETMERTCVLDADVLRYTGRTARLKPLPEMPTGPMNRVAENSLAKKLLG